MSFLFGFALETILKVYKIKKKQMGQNRVAAVQVKTKTNLLGKKNP